MLARNHDIVVLLLSAVVLRHGASSVSFPSKAFDFVIGNSSNFEAE